MNDEFVVREASPDDAEGIARVHVSSWQVTYRDVFSADALAALDETRERRVAFWTRRLVEHADRASTFVALSHDRIVGFVAVGPTRDEDASPERVGELTAIYVSPERWGLGAGRLLMQAAVERLVADGFAEATLWVLERNPRARRFYEAAGWSLDGTVKDDVIFATSVREVRYGMTLR